MPRRRTATEGKKGETGRARSDKVYSVYLEPSKICHKTLLRRETFKSIEIRCGCEKCRPLEERHVPQAPRQRCSDRELKLQACTELRPNPYHSRLVLSLAGEILYELRLAARGLARALAAGNLEPLSVAAAKRFLDTFDVDGERRREERRAAIRKQREDLVQRAINGESQAGVPHGNI